MTTKKKICRHCVQEPHLQREIARLGTKFRCSYCPRCASACDLTQLADWVSLVFTRYYRRTPVEPNSQERSSLPAGLEWRRRGTSVVNAIAQVAEIPRAAAADIRRLLEARLGSEQARPAGEETEFSRESCYEQRDGDANQWREQWFAFEHAIKTHTRFFGHDASELLAGIFADIDNPEKLSAGDHPLVAGIGPGAYVQSLYRARVFESDDALRRALCRPDRELGPPPARLAAAGRMNARGISMFYGATDAQVAIAEVRPPVGSLVAVARFDILRPLKVLSLGDLHTASAEGSMFDDAYPTLRRRTAFLRRLAWRLCRPIVPESHDLDYLPTQAIAGFLATENHPPLDGIAYPTTQIVHSGQNLALFHKAARVAELDLPDGTALEATGPTSAGANFTGYQVTESARRPEPPAETGPKRDEDPASTRPPDFREPTLRIRLESLEVHNVTHVRLWTDSHTVVWQTNRVPD